MKDSGARYLLTETGLVQTAVDTARAVNLREVFVLGDSDIADDARRFWTPEARRPAAIG